MCFGVRNQRWILASSWAPPPVLVNESITCICQCPMDSFYIGEYVEFSEEFIVTRNLISVIDDDESVRRTTTLLIPKGD